MNQSNHNILVVEDDMQIQKFICYTLGIEGFQYDAAATGHGAMSKLVSDNFELLLLDLGLPDIDGMDIIKKLREWSEMPIIVISARDQDKEKAAALDIGADDYLTKPFSTTELLARIRVAFRHINKLGNHLQQAALSVGDIQVNLEKRHVYLNEHEIHMTPLEYSLLVLLFKHQGKVLTTTFIIKELWGAGYGTDTQALRTLMAGLRRKIEINPAKPRYILTEIGVGYRLVDE